MPHAQPNVLIALSLLIHLGCGTNRVAIAPPLLERPPFEGPGPRDAEGAGPQIAKGASPRDAGGRAASKALASKPRGSEVGFAPSPLAPDTAATVADEPRVVELEGARSEALSCRLHNPMPGGVTAGYAADTGLDLAGSPRDVFAIASGTLEYAETGHTAWNGRHDSPWAVRLRLDEPIAWHERTVTHVWYAHLSEVAREVKEGAEPTVHVRAGTRLGKSGRANGSPHLHLGMLLDGKVDQSWGTFLSEDEVRRVLCAQPRGHRLR